MRQVVCQKICQIECQKHVAEIGANRSRIHGRDSQTKWSRCIICFTILNISPYLTEFTVKGSSGIPFRRNYCWNMWNQWTFWGRQHDWPDFWTHTSWKSQTNAFGDPLIFCPWEWLQPLRKQALMPFAARRCKPLRNCLAFQCPPGNCSLPLSSWADWGESAAVFFLGKLLCTNKCTM